MARPKEFDTTEVLNKALEIFWYKGYEATSIQDLTKHLGIGRQSLYDTFGGKRQLFFAALKRYTEQKTTYVVSILEKTSSGKAAIERVFRELVKTLTDAELCIGCFMVNTAIELAPHDREIGNIIESNMEQEVQALYHALTRAKSQGELNDRHQDLMALARFLNNTRYGLVVTAKSTSNPAVLGEIVDVTLSMLD